MNNCRHRRDDFLPGIPLHAGPGDAEVKLTTAAADEIPPAKLAPPRLCLAHAEPWGAANSAVIFCKGNTEAKLLCWGGDIKQAEKNRDKCPWNFRKKYSTPSLPMLVSACDDCIFYFFLPFPCELKLFNNGFYFLQPNDLWLTASTIFVFQLTTYLILISNCNSHLISLYSF